MESYWCVRLGEHRILVYGYGAHQNVSVAANAAAAGELIASDSDSKPEKLRTKHIFLPKKF